MLSALFASIADAIISYAIDKIDPAEAVKSWLRRDPVTLAFQKSLARTYSAFARQYPDYANSLFDKTFLTGKAVPELSKLLTRGQHPDPALLAQAWGESMGAGSEFSKSAIKPASDFLLWLEAELKGEPALQPLFDSRALDNIETGIEKLTQEIQRGLDAALKSANNYQQATIYVGGNVSNSNIIVGDNNTVNQYFYSGDFVSLSEYYIPPDRVFQRVRVDEFVGRDWLTDNVDAFLNDPSRKSGAFLLVGDAGVGKTAFMAHLVKERRYLHLFAEQVPGQAMLQRALQSLGSQLVTRYQIAPYNDRDTLNVLAGTPLFLENLLHIAANTLTAGEKIVIVCDALDEAGVFPDHFVFGLPKELPDGVYLILSQRPVNTKLPNFEPLRFDLKAQGEDNLQDMEAYLRVVAKRSAVAGQIRAKEYSDDFFIQTMKEKSLGVWMYLHYIVKEIEEGSRAPLDLANLPKGLVGYYADYWADWRYGRKGRGKGEEAWNELYAPLLTTLAAAQDAITAKQLAIWANVKVDSDDVDVLLHEKWRSFILEKEVEGNVLYTLYHLSFRDFIIGNVDISKIPVEQSNLVRDLTKKTTRAHKHIVDIFEKECHGKWEELVEQKYPRMYLTAHLHGAKEYKKLIDLLTEGDRHIKWAEAREKIDETYSEYLNDLTYVWDYAEREENYALAIRCMLIENSIHSLAANIPPGLLAQLAKAGLWSYTRCLSVIGQKSDSQNIAKALELIVPDLPRQLLHGALSITHKIKEEHTRAQALMNFVPYLNDELMARALSAACGFENENARASILEYLAPHLNDDLKIHALAAICEIEDGYDRSRVLTALATHSKDEFKTQILAAACEIKDESVRFYALTSLAPHLNDELKAQLFAAAREIKDKSNLIHTLDALAPYLNDELKAQALQEALSAVHEIKDETNLAYAVATLAPHLNNELKAQALAAARKIEDERDRAYILVKLAPYFSDELKVQMLSVASEIEDESTRADTLIDLIPYLNDELKSQILAATYEIEDENARTSILVKLAPYISDELKAQMLSAASEIKDELTRAHTLIDLIPYLNDELKAQMLSAASQIIDESIRARTLVDLVPNFSDKLKTQALQRALSAAREIEIQPTHTKHLRPVIRSFFQDEFTGPRTRILADISLHLTDKLKTQVLQEALSAISEINNESTRAKVLADLVPHLNNELKTEILSIAHKINNGYTRAAVLAYLAQYLNDELKIQVFQEALSATYEINDEDQRTLTLATLSPYLTDELNAQVLAATREIKDEYYRVDVLATLARYAHEEIKKQILAATYEIENENARARILVDLAPYFNDELKTQIFSATCEIEDEYFRANALIALLPYLNNEIKVQALQEALVAAREIKEEEEDFRANALISLLPYLNNETKVQVLQEALVAARKIEKEFIRIRRLTALMPYLNDELKIKVLQEAFSAARVSKDKYNCVCSLADLVPYLNDESKTQALQEALSAARDSDNAHGEAFARIAPHLTDELQTQAFAIALDFKDEHPRSNILAALAPHLNDELKVQALSMARGMKHALSRVRILAALVPHLNGELQAQVLQDVLFQVVAGYSQLSKYQNLEILAQCLNEEFKTQVLSVARKIKDEKARAHTLTALVSSLNNEMQIGVLQELLYISNDNRPLMIWKEIEFKGLKEHFIKFFNFVSQKNRGYGMEVIGKLTPALIHFRGPDIAPELFRAIVDTARWWP